MSRDQYRLNDDRDASCESGVVPVVHKSRYSAERNTVRQHCKDLGVECITYFLGRESATHEGDRVHRHGIKARVRHRAITVFSLSLLAGSSMTPSTQTSPSHSTTSATSSTAQEADPATMFAGAPGLLASFLKTASRDKDRRRKRKA